MSRNRAALINLFFKKGYLFGFMLILGAHENPQGAWGRVNQTEKEYILKKHEYFFYLDASYKENNRAHRTVI